MMFNEQSGFRLCDSFVAANETYAEFGFLPLGKMNFTKQVDFTFAIFHLFLDAPRIFFFGWRICRAKPAPSRTCIASLSPS